MSEQRLDYRVNVHHEDGSYWAEVVDLPGCFASGETLDELWEALTEAVGMYLSTPESGVQVQIADHEVDAGSTVEAVDARVLVC